MMSGLEKLHKSQVFLVLLLAFLAGIVLGNFFDPRTARILFYSSAIFAIVPSTAAWGSKKWWIVSVAVFIVGFGVWYFQAAKPVIDKQHIASFNGGAKIEWEGAVVEEPDVRRSRANLTLEARELLSPARGPISGKVLITIGRYPEYRYGELIRVLGTLEEPFETEEFSYKNYLAKDEIYSVSRFPKVEKLSDDQGNFLKAALLSFKTYFVSKLSQVLPEPQNSLLLGLLVGARRSLPADLLEVFKITGVTHIIAISGFNISIITRLLGRFVQKYLGPRWSLIISALVVLGFVVITGAQASVVRAAIMGMLVVIALNVGRASQMFNALILAAGVMVFLKPQILLFDTGFQLSFLATLGLISLADYFERFFHKVPEAFEIRGSLCATLSAQIFVWPLLIFYFDQLSVIAPLANVLILPLIPWAMFFGFLSGLLALVWLPLSYLAAWITWAFLSYQIKITEALSQVPFAAVKIEELSLSWVLGYYVLLFLLVFGLSVRRRQKIIWEFAHPRGVSPP